MSLTGQKGGSDRYPVVAGSFHPGSKFIPLKNQPPEENSKWLVIKCGPSWARTSDPLIMSQNAIMALSC